MASDSRKTTPSRTCQFGRRMCHTSRTPTAATAYAGSSALPVNTGSSTCAASATAWSERHQAGAAHPRPMQHGSARFAHRRLTDEPTPAAFADAHRESIQAISCGPAARAAATHHLHFGRPRRAIRTRPRAMTSHGSLSRTSPPFTAAIRSTACGLGPTRPAATHSVAASTPASVSR